MKIRLTFVEMQEFIRYVSDMVVKYGFGYKDFLIRYCSVKYYGSKINPPILFENEDIQKIYDEEYDKLTELNYIPYDDKQYETIIEAIDKEIEASLNAQNMKNIMSDFNNTITEFIGGITKYVEKQGEMLDNEQIGTMAKAITSIGENVNADTLTKAMIENGVIKGKRQGRKPKTK